jgi:hypothetical protein
MPRQSLKKPSMEAEKIATHIDQRNINNFCAMAELGIQGKARRLFANIPLELDSDDGPFTTCRWI